MVESTKKRIFGLDLMRASAIILVVISHCSWFFSDLEGIPLSLLNYAGLFGVEIFFVLSGFLIGRILYQLVVVEDFSKNKLIYFWKRRWLRTLPNYYLVLLINITLGYFLYQDLPTDVWKYFLFIQNFWSEQSPFFYESWSLSIEEFAYIIGPLLIYISILLPLKLPKKKLFLWTTTSVILIFTFTKIKYHLFANSTIGLAWTVQLKSVVIYRIDTIYYGFIAAYLSINYATSWVQRRFTLLVLSMLLFIGFNLWVSVHGASNQFVWNVLYLPINSIAIALSIPFFSNFKLQKGWFYNVITFISIISYSIYLLHYSIILKLYKFYLPNELSSIKQFVVILSYFAITLLLSYILYKSFEKPMLNLRKDIKSTK